MSDQSGQRFVGRPGDVIYIPRGSTGRSKHRGIDSGLLTEFTVTFETEEGGKTFFVSALSTSL